MNENEKYRARQTKAGQKGGLATKKRHGTKFFAKIARRRWRKVKMLRRTRDV